MKRTIAIIGPIGSFSYRGKEVNGVQLVDVVSQVAKYSDTKELIVEVGSPGGSVTVAKHIRAYLKSLQPRMTVTTKQVDDIESAGTIVFGSGSKRIAAKGINPNTGNPFRFMVHNSWVTHTEGNKEALAKEMADLESTDDEMISMYQEDTGISRESIMPLMKAESFFTADNALSLKFATETYEAQNQAAYKPMNTDKDKKDNSVLDEILAAIKGMGKKKSKKVAVAPPAELMGKAVTIDGKAAVDGVYTVQGGVITLLAEVPAAGGDGANGDSATTASKKDDAKLEEVLALLKKLDTGKAKKTKAEDDDDDDDDSLDTKIASAIEKAIKPIKQNTKSTHVPVGFTPENKTADAAEWDRSFKANEHVAMRKNDPERWTRLYYAKYGKMPSNV